MYLGPHSNESWARGAGTTTGEPRPEFTSLAAARSYYSGGARLPQGDYWAYGATPQRDVPYRGEIRGGAAVAGGDVDPTLSRLAAARGPQPGFRNYGAGVGYDAALRNYYDAAYDPLALARSEEHSPLPYYSRGAVEKFGGPGGGAPPAAGGGGAGCGVASPWLLVVAALLFAVVVGMVGSAAFAIGRISALVGARNVGAGAAS